VESKSKHVMPWEAVQQKVLDYLVNGDPHHPLVISVYPGGGKTTNTLAVLFGYAEKVNEDKKGEKIREIITVALGPHSFRFAYLAPRHNVVYDAMDRVYGDDSVHFESRLRLCDHPEVKRLLGELEGENRSFFPLQYFCHSCQYRHVSKNEIVLANGVEAEAGIQSQCPYERRKYDVENQDMVPWGGVHHHIITYLKDYLDGEINDIGHGNVKRESRMDALIIEENPMKTLMETQHMDKDDIVMVRDEVYRFGLFTAANRERFCENMDFSGHVGVYRDIMEFLLKEIHEVIDHPSLQKGTRSSSKTPRPPDCIGKGMIIPAAKTNWNEFENLVNEWRLLDWEDFDRYWGRYLGMRMFEDIEKYGVDDDVIQVTLPRLRYVSKALGLFHRLLGKIFSVSNVETMQHHFSMVDENWTVDRDVYYNVNYFHGDVLPSIKCKIIALDGTGDKDTWDRILGKECEFFPEKGFYDNVTRVTFKNDKTCAYYYTSTYLNHGKLTSTGKDILDLVALIVKTHAVEPGEEVAIIGPKSLARFVKDACDSMDISKDKYRYEHYYNLTSDNRMQGCDTIITLTTPQAPEGQVNASIALSGWPKDVWMKHYVDNEMVQAIARVRPVLDTKPHGHGLQSVKRLKPVKIYVLGSQDIFSGSRKEEVVWEHYQEMTRTQLEGKLKYGGDGSIAWTKKELQSVATVMAMTSNIPCTKTDIQAHAGLTWGMAKRVVFNLVKLGYLSFTKGEKVVKVKDVKA